MTILLCASWAAAAESPVDFQRDVRPVLAKKCFKCHGPDKQTREADLRLDTFAGATSDASGTVAIVPGKSTQSELMHRIESPSPDDRMPPADSGLQLSESERENLRRWIDAGAKYDQHWSFVRPTLPEIPTVKNPNWPINPIDDFVLARLEQQGLSPSPAADRYALVRRLYLDLIGLPPTIEQADAFVNNSDPQAYELLVDELLASPHYGERWARHWLDLARYADTNGYEKDRPRSIWPYRDWVIQALNADLPFDQFTIEQLAGDMLPDPTQAQLIATGFHRNTMLNEEGGIDPLEYRFYSMVDRAATTGTVWMGMTIGCAQCHTHKYDPVTQTDYYALFGLLNNADEPDLILPDQETQVRREEILKRIKALEQRLPDAFPPLEGEGSEAERRAAHREQKFSEWRQRERKAAKNWQILEPVAMATNLPRLERLPDGSLLSSGDITKRDVFNLDFDLKKFEAPITAIRLEVLPDDRLPARGPGRAFYEGRQGDFFLSEVTATIADAEIPLHEPSHSFGKISIGNGTADAGNVLDRDGSTGWSTATREGEAHQLVLNLQEPLITNQPLKIELLFERHFAASLGRFRFWVTTDPGLARATALPVELVEKLRNATGEISPALRKELFPYFLHESPDLVEARKPIVALRNKLPDFPTTMIFRERSLDYPRVTHRHHRGEYLQSREVVNPGLPELFLSSTPARPSNRLEFARWLVSPENPLVGRVTVNRNWQEFFGRGLVRTSEDFGTQSSDPSHPELLDWLAVQFTSAAQTETQGLNWSVKQLHRLIVLSATYRQQAVITPELLARDPENILLARGPRYRLDAEMIRDLALQASGLLSESIGGPSVYPPQPSSVTTAAYGSPAWTASPGAERYRRSLYTFAKRTAPFAAYTVFDAPTGENCIVRRDRSNTPLQALTVLNDEMFLEAARAAAKAVTVTGGTETAFATQLFRRFQTRYPTDAERTALLEFYHQQLTRFAAGELAAKDITKDEAGTAELAAWIMVARVILNLDETVTKP